MSNPNTKNPGKPTLCDLETNIAIEINTIARDIELNEMFDVELYKHYIAEDIKNSIARMRLGARLIDDDIKIKVFLHEKDENAPKTE